MNLTPQGPESSAIQLQNIYSAFAVALAALLALAFALARDFLFKPASRPLAAALQGDRDRERERERKWDTNNTRLILGAFSCVFFWF